MFLTPKDRVTDHVSRGWWGEDTVDQLFQRVAAAGGDAPALIDPSNRAYLDGVEPMRLSWRELQSQVERVAAGLLAAGLRKDDIIAVQLPNTVDAVQVFLASARIGLIISPVVMQYREHELDFILDAVGAKAFVTIPAFGRHDHGAMAARLAATRPELRVLLFHGDGGPHDLSATAADPALVAPYVAANPTLGAEVLTICWTSGTEARPKGCRAITITGS